MTLQTCPTRDRLDSFQAGDLEEVALAMLASHVEACTTCQRSLETVIGESADSVVTALLEDAPPGAFAAEAHCREAVERVAALAGSSVSSPNGSEATIASEGQPGVSQQSAPLPVASIREYKLLAKIGEGGMGAVYKALHTRLDKVVAVKILPADRMRDPGSVARFQREMKAVGRLDHPNIVRAMDAGEEGGMHFLVMEYVEGLDLSQLAKATGPLPIADACELVRQAALGLAEAHEHGMVHRDIKPNNLILAKSRRKNAPPTVKILDLGLALLSEALAPDNGGLTTSGQMMGTIDYMAPEQAGDTHQVDIRADIYSLGATLYRLLTGAAPFSGDKFDTPVKKILALATQAPTALEARRPDVPRRLAAIVTKMLAKDPKDRPATPEEVAEALAPFCQSANLAALLTRGSSAGASLVVTDSEAGTRPHLSAGSADTAPTIEQQAGVGAAVHRRAHAAIGRKIPRSYAIAAAFGGAALAALFGITFFLQTPNGTVRVEIKDKNIQVFLDKNSATFQGVDKKHEIKVTPGKHGLTIKRGDFSFETDKFEVRKGETLRLSVEFLAGKVRVVRADGTSLGERIVDVGSDFALEFDGKTAYVAIPSLRHDTKDPITIEAWIKSAGPNAVNTPIVSGYTPTSGVTLSRMPNGAVAWIINSGGEENVRAESDFPVKNGVWVHLAACWDGKTSRLFVDGKLQSTPVARFEHRVTAKFSDQPFFIGAHRFWPGDNVRGFFHGAVDEVRISKVARYDKDFTPPRRYESDADTLALYHFDEGQGDMLKDSSGYDHHGKIVGAKWVRAEGLPPATPAVAPQIATPLPARFALDLNSELTSGTAHVRVPKILQGPEPLTIEMRITPRKPSAPGKNRLLFALTGSLILKSVSGTDLYWQGPPTSPGEYPQVLARNAMRPGRPMHVAGVSTGKELRLYVDGYFMGKHAVELSPHPEGYCFLGGTNRSEADWEPFDSLIHEVRISKTARYDKDFTPNERLEPDTDTLILYDFHEGEGDLLHDRSGAAHHGTIVGAKWVRLDGSIPPVTTTAPSQVVDLLKLVDVNRDAVKGKWTLTADGLASDGSVPFCRLKLPYAPPPEYDFRVEFTAAGGNDILQLFTVGGRSCTWLMGAWGGRHDGFDTVRDHPLTREGTNIIGGPTSIRRGQRHTSLIQVRRNSITATIDGKQIVRHETDGSDLGMPDAWSIGEGAIGLGTTFDAVVFHKVELIVPAAQNDGAGWHGWPADAPPPAIAPFDAAQAKAHQRTWATHLGVPVEYTNSIGMKFRLLPPGEFLMGSAKGDPNEASPHKVTLTRPYYLGTYEATQDEYQAVIGSNPSKFDGKLLPVEFVTAQEAMNYCRKLSEREGKNHRLPTEAEWEFACRGGTTTEWHFGDDPATLGDYAWHNENAGDRSHPVGEKKPNPFGLFDMHGNVFEYCSDYTGAYSAHQAVDPQGPALGRYRGFRGGSWFFKPFDTRSADRQDKEWPARGSHVGFRVVLEVDAVQEALKPGGPGE